MNYMLVSVPRLCTTVPFVYISSLIFHRVPTPFLPEAGACSLSASFSPFTHTQKLASCSVLPSWLGGEQPTTTKKKSLTKKSSDSPFLPLTLKLPGAHLLHTAFQLSAPTPWPSAHPTPVHTICVVLTCRLHSLWWGYGYLFVKDTLFSLLRCQTSKLLILGGSDGEQFFWRSLMVSSREKECHIFWMLLGWSKVCSSFRECLLEPITTSPICFGLQVHSGSCIFFCTVKTLFWCTGLNLDMLLYGLLRYGYWRGNIEIGCLTWV